MECSPQPEESKELQWIHSPSGRQQWLPIAYYPCSEGPGLARRDRGRVR